MAAKLKKVAPGWLARSIADSKRYYEANKAWCDAVRANWRERR